MILNANIVKKLLLSSSFIVVLVFSGGALCASELDQLVSEALSNNPALATAKARWEQASYKPDQVGSLKDPVLSLALSNYPSGSLSSSETPMTGNEVKLAQAIPFPGKLNARSTLATEQARWFESSYRDMHYQVSRKVKDAWFRLYFKERAIEVTERNLALVDDVIRLTEVRYETGSGLQQDVLKAQIQRSKLMERMLALQQQRATISSELDRLLAKESPGKYTPPQHLELKDLKLGLSDYLSASQNRPLHAAYSSLLRRYQQQKRLARLDEYPDVTIWGSWRFRDDDLPDKGTDFVSAGISFNLPVYKVRRRAALAEASAAVRMVQRQAEDFNDSVTESISKAFARMEETQQQALLYKGGIIPQTSQSFQAALGSYQVGKVAFISLLDALMTTYKAEMEYYRVSSEYMRSLAWLESESTLPILGVPIQIDGQTVTNSPEIAN